MRRLALLALATLAAFPLSAHGRWERRRPVVMVEPCRPYPRWEARRWDRCEPYDCAPDRVVLRPLPPPPCRPLVPFRGRVELWIR
ncbi:hypothetical protein [Geothrix sp. 21YS21S-4]|uniref:hypothetical protein n=1 Tax=Geothrix sp. 21YS21S-4 TaxID=3068889 RepID=UPI0027B8B8E8|nr:hypothetical protein [Geothrix sp. 21YS21S-4]